MMSSKMECLNLWNLKLWYINTMPIWCSSFSPYLLLLFVAHISSPFWTISQSLSLFFSFPLPLCHSCLDHNNIFFIGPEENPGLLLRLNPESKQMSLKSWSSGRGGKTLMFKTFSQGFQDYYPSLFGKPSQLKAFICKTFLYKELTVTESWRDFYRFGETWYRFYIFNQE